MSKFKKFGEFVQKKKQDLLKAKDGLAGEDYDGPLAIKPPQEPTNGQYTKPLPYKAGGEEANGVVWTAPDDGSKKPLGQEATPGISPQTSSLGKKPEDKAKARPKPKKLTTEQFIEKTKKMSDSEFVNYLLDEHSTEITTVTDLFGNEFTPDPQQSIEYVAGLMLGNPYYMEKFIRELKRRDGLQDMMTEMFQHGDTYDLVVDHLEDPEFGSARAGKLARTMNDRYMKIMDDFDFGDEDLGESVSPGLDAVMPGPSQTAPKAQGGATGGGSGPDATPDVNYQSGSEFSQDGGKSNPMGSAGPGRNPGRQGGQPLGGQNNPQFGAGPIMPPMPPKKMKEGGDPKFRGNSAGLHLINELSGYPAFKKHMLDRCLGPNCPKG